MIEKIAKAKSIPRDNFNPRKIFLATIPPNIWNGFKGIDTEKESIIANCLDNPMMRKKWSEKIYLINILILIGN